MEPGLPAQPDSLVGYFLIAETELQDPNFFRTVVFIIHHTEEGAFGLVINRKSEVTVGSVIEGIDEAALAEMPLYVGGPVQQNYVFCLHGGVPERYRSEHGEEPAGGIFFEPSFQHVIDYASTEDFGMLSEADRPAIRVFAGYSGWGPGQLESELEEGAWLIHPAFSEVIFAEDPSQGWKDVLSRKGSFYRIVAEIGYKPSMN